MEGDYDPFIQIAIASEDYFCSTVKGLIDAHYLQPAEAKVVEDDDVRLCILLKEPGPGPQSSLFTMKPKQLNRMSISMGYAAMAVRPLVLK